MAKDIKLTPDLLEQQSMEMSSLQAEYEALFKKVTTALHGINNSWSENLASNFEGKITGAQKNFSSIANMLANGSAAAKVSSLTFSAGTGLNNNLLSSFMGSDFQNLVNQLGPLSSLVSGGSASELAKWINENKEMLDEKGAEIISSLTGLGVSDVQSIQDIMGKVSNGDIEGALRAAVEKGSGILGGMGGSELPEGSWVKKLEDATGGTLKLASLEADYMKNIFNGVGQNVIDLGKDLVTGKWDFGNEGKIVGEMLWNVGPGAVIETGADAAWDVVKDIPVIGDYYKEAGVTDSTGAIGKVLGDIHEMITGNSEDAAYVQNYYTDHGGIGKGIVDGIVNIYDFIYESVLRK